MLKVSILTPHFPDSLRQFPFKEGGIYYLLGTVEVDYHFPTVTITRMAKVPPVVDPRYSMDEEKSKEIELSLREDVSLPSRTPYPQEHEIELPREKWKICLTIILMMKKASKQVFPLSIILPANLTCLTITLVICCGILPD